MIIIGVDFHPEFQQIASVDTDTGEFQERRLTHPEESEKFYRALAATGQRIRAAMEASGHARWFERLLAELRIELWIGDAAEIQSKRARKQKTDRQDAQHILKLMLKEDFPRIWEPRSSPSPPAGSHFRREARRNPALCSLACNKDEDYHGTRRVKLLGVGVWGIMP